MSELVMVLLFIYKYDIIHIREVLTMSGTEFGVGLGLFVFTALIWGLKMDGYFQKCKKCGSRLTTIRGSHCTSHWIYVSYVHCWRCGTNIWPAPWHLMNKDKD